MRKKIKETIVVEGRDDITAVKAAVDAELIEVNGFAVRKRSTLEKIKNAQERTGVIILTDPDFAGEKIRKTIENYVPGVRHAYIGRKEGTRLKDGNVGVENASPSVIIRALNDAKCKLIERNDIFTSMDMLEYGLTGGDDSKNKRQIVGVKLGIGYGNGKQFLAKLNHFGITKDEFLKAMEK
ncbi:ribonuclease M5 [Ilyobacter polytropus]|uniref:Ribonuclease M5 n=1 Tax=Ilyobacter polytropus (strain ATCC 51220 / DSM 2926 / LMG 16218 / CuHBu1) TaxID=572544 RepID=E3H7T4_ILYPC|nr:ribonuclease M5 [Ilyobacter polytropus]ADO82666.1 RNAse M5 [Ilyobacter polytropus DSM 2926]